VEKIDQEAGKLGTFWPSEWLSNDFPQARLFTLKYKVCLSFSLFCMHAYTYSMRIFVIGCSIDLLCTHLFHVALIVAILILVEIFDTDKPHGMVWS
jgi:hypothetical protein